MNIQVKAAEEHVLEGKSFVIYGFENQEDQNKLESVIEKYGGQVRQDLDPSISFLITTPAKAKHIQTAPIQTAIQLGIPVVSETFIWQCLTNKTRITPHDLVPQSRTSVMVERLLGHDFPSNPSSAHSHSISFSATFDREPFETAELYESGNYWTESSFRDRFEDSDEEEAEDRELSSSLERPEHKYQLFPLVPSETSNHVEQRLEWQRLLSTYLTGDELEKERKKREHHVSMSAGKRSEILWIELNAKLLRFPVDEFCRQLDIHRNECIGLLMNNVIGFSIDHRDDYESVFFDADIIEATIIQYQEAKSLFPTKAAFLKYLTDTGVDKDKLVKEIMDPLQSWLTMKKTTDHILTGIRSMFCCPDTATNIPHNVIQELLESRSIRTLFERRIFVSIDDLCEKFHATFQLYQTTWTRMHLEPLIPQVTTICNFPLQLMQSCLSYRKLTTEKLLSHIGSKQSPDKGSLQLLTSISQFADDLRDGISVAISQRDKFLKRFQVLISDFDPGSSNVVVEFKIQLSESLKLYMILVQDLYRLGKYGLWYRNQELLQTEWLYLKQSAKDINGMDEVISTCIFQLVYRSVLLMSYWVQTEMQPRLDRPIDSVKEADSVRKRYSLLLENIQLRSRKILQFCKEIKAEFESCSILKLNSPDTDGFIKMMVKLGYHGYSIPNQKLILFSKLDLKLLERCLRFTINVEFEDSPAVVVSVSDNFKSAETFIHVENVFTESLYPIKNGEVLFISKSHHESELIQLLQQLTHDGKPYLTRCGQKLTLSQNVNQIIQKIDKSIAKFMAVVIKQTQSVRLYLTAAPVEDIASNQNSPAVDLLASYFSFFSSLGNQTLLLLPNPYKSFVIKNMIELAMEWISFTCSDCSPLDKKTFRWALMALEFVMWVTRGRNILILSEEAFTEIRRKVACCMTLLISGISSAGGQQVADNSFDKDEEEFENLESAINEVLQLERYADEGNTLDLLNHIELKREQMLRGAKRIGKTLDTSNPSYKELMNLLSVSTSKVSIRWQQGKFIGGGAFGHVYLGINMDTGDLLAVKEIQFQSTPLSTAKMVKQSFASQNSHISRIKEEMRVLEQMNHPNVVQYFGIEVHKDRCMLFMEYCPNGSLRTLLENAGRIDDESIITLYAFELLQGIRYLHTQKIIHRDIKPDNLLFDQNGVLKLVDFGAAKIVQQTTDLFELKNNKEKAVRVKASLTGTANYLAPEVITGKVEHGRFGAQDIWSAACVIVEMATGKRPWSHLDNEWAILYNIGLSHKHPDLPAKISQTSISADSARSHVMLSDCAIDMLQDCFKTADSRPSADELLDNYFFNDVKRKLELFRTQTNQHYPNPWTNAGHSAVSSVVNSPSLDFPSSTVHSNRNFNAPSWKP